MKAIIMAGGEGTRLRPLTCGLPKPMTPILNRPAMEYTVRLLARHGVTEIGVTLRYLPETVKRYFGDGSRFGVRLRYFVETRPLGTAGGVRGALDFLDGPFFVMSGDAVTDVDLTAMATYHREKRAKATMALREEPVPLEYGVAATDGDGRITRFLEKPDWSEAISATVNTGIYLLEPETLAAVPEQETTDFSRDLFPAMLERGERLYGYVTRDYWRDIGDLRSYLQCQRELLSGRARLETDGAMSRGRAAADAGANLTGPVFLGKNVKIGRGAVVGPYAVVGDNCEIGDRARVEGSVLWAGVRVGADAVVRGATVCDQAEIGPGAVVMENAAVGARSTVEPRAQIYPGVKVWNEKRVCAGSVLKRNLIDGRRYGGETFGRACLRGEISGDVTAERMIDLGSAFCATLAEDGPVGVFARGGACADALCDAFLAGAISSGARTVVFDALPLDAARFAVRAHMLAGGVYVCVRGQNAAIRFLGPGGADVTRDRQRKLEAAYVREEFVRCAPERMRAPTRVENEDGRYLKRLLDSCTVRRLDYRVGLAAEDDATRELAYKAFAALGVRAQDVGNRSELARAVARDGLDFGVALEENRPPRYVTGDGTEASDETFFALAALIALTAFPRSRLYVPADASDLVRYVARDLDGELAPVGEFMATLATARDGANRLLYQLLFDGIASVLRVMEFMRYNSLSLADMTRLLPRVFRLKRDVFCPNDRKGRVVGALIDQFGDVDLTEGVKVRYRNGWILALPDRIESVFHILSESDDAELAEERCADLAERVRRLTQ